VVAPVLVIIMLDVAGLMPSVTDVGFSEHPVPAAGVEHVSDTVPANPYCPISVRPICG
jgi:hypothetical protein